MRKAAPASQTRSLRAHQFWQPKTKVLISIQHYTNQKKKIKNPILITVYIDLTNEKYNEKIVSNSRRVTAFIVYNATALTLVEV